MEPSQRTAMRSLEEPNVVKMRQGWKMRTPDKERVTAPSHHQHHHDGGHVHDAKGLLARFVDTLDVFPPEINRDRDREHRRGAIHRKKRARMEMFQQFVQQADQIKTCRYAADRARQNVVEHQSGDRELGQGGTHGLLDHAVHAATHEHAAALDVERRHRACKQHDGEDEPGRSLADEVFGNCAGIERRRTHIVQHDCGYTPERNEGEHRAGCHQYPRRRGHAPGIGPIL